MSGADELLSRLRQFSERGSRGVVLPLLVGEQVLRLDATVGANLQVREFALVEQLDDEGPGDVEQVSGLLRGQLRVRGDERDGVGVAQMEGRRQ